MPSERSWQPAPAPKELPAPAGAYSPAIRAGDFVFVSGQVPKNPATGELEGDDIRAQTRRVLEKLRLTLEAAGASLDDIVSITAYLQDENDWGAFNEVYGATFRPPYPTRTTVGAGLRGVLVEVSAVAYVGRS
ncbi:MAG TPA: Rid family hydrolase [Gemmatimonadaceae bacterium]|nr:Rid family hydrolase [Gemmatimonadaceae bacterium]